MSAWRCQECGHGRNLYAWFGANLLADVAADGMPVDTGEVEPWGVHEDSIQCRRHPNCVIEKKIGHRFHCWKQCKKCTGGYIGDGSYYSPRRMCQECQGKGGWWVLPSAIV